MPGSGKSTVSRLVAEGLERSARIRGDDLSMMIVKGGVRFDSPDRVEATRQGRLLTRGICLLARNFVEAGFTPIVDSVLPDRDVLAFVVRQLDPVPVRLVVLAPPVEVCERRNRERPVIDRVYYDIAPHEQAMRAELEGIGWWLDNQHQSPETTAAAILAAAPNLPALSGGTA